MDVEVRRPALAEEVEHAAAEVGGGVLHAPRLHGDDRRAPGVLQVDALVAAVAARISEVVPEVRFRDEREHEARHAGGPFVATLRRRCQ